MQFSFEIPVKPLNCRGQEPKKLNRKSLKIIEEVLVVSLCEGDKNQISDPTKEEDPEKVHQS